jgi:hypothetical protein
MSFAPSYIFLVKEPQCLFYCNLGGPKNRSGSGNEEKDLHPRPGIEHRFSACHTRSVVSILTELK